MAKQDTKCPDCDYTNPADSQFCNRCGTNLGISNKVSFSATQTIQGSVSHIPVGSTFAGRYQILDVLGEGGMGEVYHAFDTRFNEEVAIKVLKPEIAVQSQTIERFSNELKFARKITHKHVCRMHDLNENEGTHFITMEYVRGETLKSVIRRTGKLSLGQTVAAAMQIVSGLSEAHWLGIIHRDLKPQNIMLDEEGNAKVMDFGIARSVEAEGMTAEGMVIGTPEYMSPEQVEGIKVDQRSDVYSLGVILYEMVTGQVPFTGGSAFSIALKQKNEFAADPRTLNPDLPESFVFLIQKCMEKKPENRYQSVEELLTELIEIEKCLPEKERVTQKIMPRIETGRPKKARPKRKVSSMAVAAVAALSVVILGILVWRLLPRRERGVQFTGKPTVAILYFKNSTGDPSLDHMRESLANLFITDLMQSKYVNVLNENRLYSLLDELDLLEAKNYSHTDLENIAGATEVSHFLTGNLTRAGSNYRMTVTLINAFSQESIAAENADGKGEGSLYDMVDELTKKIKPYFNLSSDEIAADTDAAIAEISTSSQAALKFYIEAQNAYNRADWNYAIRNLEKAVALDPEFAKAYSLMATLYDNSQNDARSAEFIQKAYESGSRVSERERLAIEGRYFYVQGNTAQAIETFNTLLKNYPDDYNGNFRLGQAFFERLEAYDDAEAYFLKLLDTGAAEFMVYSYLGQIQVFRGRYDKAKDYYQLGIDKFPDNWIFYCLMTQIHAMEGDYDAAQSELEKGFYADPKGFTACTRQGEIAIFQEDFVGAENYYLELLNSEEKQIQRSGRLGLIYLYSLQQRFQDVISLVEQSGEDRGDDLTWQATKAYMELGRYEAALTLCERWEDKAASTFMEGLIYARQKAWDKATEMADRLKTMVEAAEKDRNYPQLMHRYHLSLVGTIALEKKNYTEAIEYLNQVKAWIFNIHDELHAFYIEPLARAYFLSGDIENARIEYESIISMTYGRLAHGDVYAKSLSMRGQPPSSH